MLPRQGAPVQALVGELTSHMPQVKPKKKNNVFFFFCYGYAQIYSFKYSWIVPSRWNECSSFLTIPPSSCHGVSHSETPITLPSLDWRDRSPNSEPKPFHTHSVPVTAQKYTCHFNQVAAPIIFSNFALVYVVPPYRIYSCFFTCINYTRLSCPPQVSSFFFSFLTSYLFFGLCVYHVGSSSLTRDRACAPLHLEPGVLATGPLVKSSPHQFLLAPPCPPWI